MKNKRPYVKPVVKTEKVEIGVFGGYGSTGGKKNPPIQFFNPLFNYCCN